MAHLLNCFFITRKFLKINERASLEVIIRYMRWSLLSVLVGVLAGGVASVFLVLLQWATSTREHYPVVIYALPLAGLVIGLLYHHYGRSIAAGPNLILDEIHNPKNKVPLRMAPLILLGTVMTHLCGGSAGREGAAVQMSASLADQVAAFFRVEPAERKILLVAGMGAGFGAAIGAPWAGMIFGLEVLQIGKLKLFACFECLLASSVGYGVTRLLHAPHADYVSVPAIPYGLRTLFIVSVVGCLCGVSAWLFIRATHGVEKLLKRFIAFPPLRPMLVGILLVVLYRLEGSYVYSGLGLTTIQAALSQPAEWQLPLLKGFFTALTIGSGFKGGEFVPLVFIGTTLGSALSIFFHVSTPLLAALGFVAVFAGAANTPLTCTVLAMELFGPRLGGYAFVACLFSYYCSGYSGIYRAQPVVRLKHHHFIALKKRFTSSA